MHDQGDYGSGGKFVVKVGNRELQLYAGSENKVMAFNSH